MSGDHPLSRKECGEDIMFSDEDILIQCPNFNCKSQKQFETSAKVLVSSLTEDILQLRQKLSFLPNLNS